MRIIEDTKLDYSDVLIVPHRSTLSSRADVSLERTFEFRNSKNAWTGIPLIAANMTGTGTMNMHTELSKHQTITALHKHYNLNDLVLFFSLLEQHYVFYSIGITEKDLEKYNAVNDVLRTRTNRIIQNVCIDVANGYSESFLEFVKQFREQNPRVNLMAGNVVTPDVTEALILAGVDIVKVGIGPGSVCTTRKMTGVGYPQLSAVIECADAAHGLGGHICADGGCVVPGDVSKAFGGGADFVMLGGMLAGTSECEGDLVYKDGKGFVTFYGMSSKSAMTKHNGCVAEYRASEGKEVLIPYKGPVNGVIKEILGGIRSTCTYVGAKSLKELSKRTTFIRVSRQLNTSFNQHEV